MWKSTGWTSDHILSNLEVKSNDYDIFIWIDGKTKRWMVHFAGDAWTSRDPPFEQMINNYLSSSPESISCPTLAPWCGLYLTPPGYIPSHPYVHPLVAPRCNIHTLIVDFDESFNFDLGTNLGPKTSSKWLKLDTELLSPYFPWIASFEIHSRPPFYR